VLGERDAGRQECVIAPAFGAVCGLCQSRFREGDAVKTVWRRGRVVGKRTLGFNAHLGCFGQLLPGDLTRLFGCLERRLTLPLAVLNGQRVDLGRGLRLAKGIGVGDGG
jgi:hypothetical protein